MEKWRCTVCGYIHEGPLPKDFTCPRCKQPASAFVPVREEAVKGAGKYAGTKTEKNLEEAFSGESQARNKYTFFAAVPPMPPRASNHIRACSCSLRAVFRNSSANCS